MDYSKTYTGKHTFSANAGEGLVSLAILSSEIDGKYIELTIEDAFKAAMEIIDAINKI